MAQAPRRSRLHNIDNTGFGASTAAQGGRLTNRDGTFNMRKTGIPWWERLSLYHTLLRLPRWQFFLAVFAFYTGMNLVFAVVYFTMGVEHLAGADHVETTFDKFTEAFFFSSQTLTTVGYGRVAPMGLLTNIIASVESLVGIVSFALVTGLFYGRFSRPKAYILFSRHLLISPHRGGRALMFRLTTFKNNHLTDAEIQITLSQREGESRATRFYQLKPEIARINSLALNWTVVHFIDEESPLYGCTGAEIEERQMEIMVFVKAFDDHFSNTVQQRTSYHHSDIVYGARFAPMYHRAEDMSQTVLELDKIDQYDLVEMPGPENAVTE